MNNSRNTFTTSIQILTAEARYELNKHPPIDELVSYHHDADLTDMARETLQDHLALCHECTQLLLDIDQFAKLGDNVLTEQQVAADKRALVTRLSEEEPAGGGQVLPFRAESAAATTQPSVRGFWNQGWKRSRVVAAALVAAMGFSWWITKLNHRISDLSAPQVNVPVHTLLGLEDMQIRGFKPVESLLPASAASDGVFLVLASGKLASAFAYRLELRTTAGEMLWSDPHLRRDPGGRFTLHIPGRFLTPRGDYRLRIYALANDTSEVLFEEYAFRVASE